MSESNGFFKRPHLVGFRDFDTVGTASVTLNGANTGIWQSFGGLFLTLPEAGQYLIDATVCMRATAAQTGSFVMSGRVFDLTANAPVVSSEVEVMAHFVNVDALSTFSDDTIASGSISAVHTVTGPSNLTIQGLYRFITGLQPGFIRMQSGPDGRSTLRYCRVD